VQIEDGFQELDFGEWTGKTFEELASDPSWFKFNQVRSSVTPPGGESPVIVVERARRALNSAAARHDADLVAIVTHADVIRSLLTSLLGMPLDHLLRFEIEPASVTELWMGGDYPIIRSLSTLYAVEL
jgi:broad specificity phosphatase PhoE